MIALAAALLASAPLPFAPPIDRPLVYRQTEDRVARDGSAAHFILTEEVRYTRDGDGYILTIRALSAEAQAPEMAANAFRAGMKPFIGIPVAVRLSATGEPGAVIDADVTWAHVIGSLEAVAASAGDRKADFDPMLTGFRTMPPAAREAMLKGPAIALLGLSLPPLGQDETTALDEQMETPLGVALASHGDGAPGRRSRRRDPVTPPILPAIRTQPRASPNRCARPAARPPRGPMPSRRCDCASIARPAVHCQRAPALLHESHCCRRSRRRRTASEPSRNADWRSSHHRVS